MKISEGKSFFSIFLMLGFLSGILYANIFAQEYIISRGIMNEYFLEQYSQIDINAEEYLWYITRVRITPLIFICALGCTRLKRIVVGVTVLWTGFSGGILITSSVMKMGIKGIIFCLMGVIPHFAFYIGAYIIILWYFLQYPQGKWNVSKTIVCLLLILLGILLECYVNPVLMKMFIKTL
ncbi:MAG: stage II sporulation protein M [Dorea sp.]